MFIVFLDISQVQILEAQNLIDPHGGFSQLLRILEEALLAKWRWMAHHGGDWSNAYRYVYMYIYYVLYTY